VTLAVYWGVLGNGFVSFDDGDYVAGNRHVLDGLSWSGVRWALTSFEANNWHPVTWLSHMLDVSLFGVWAGGHHLVSVGFHALNAVLLLWFLRKTTGRLWTSLLVAGLFALHPLHVESVAWISERKDVLSACFLMLTLLAYAWYARKPGALRYLAVGSALAAGLMAKPMLVSVPALLLLVDYWPLERLDLTWRSVRLRVLEKVPLAVLAALSSAATLMAQSGAIAPLDQVSFLRRAVNAVVSYGTYIEQMAWPSRLAVYYAFPDTPQFGAAAAWLVLLSAATVGAVWFGRRHRYVAAGWLWYLVSLVPVVGLVQVGGQAHADRYTYVPLVGLFIVAAWALAELVDARPKLKPIAAVAAVTVLAGASLSAREQVGYWRDDVTLFGRAVDVGARNRVTLANLGSALGMRGEVDQGVAVLRQVLELAPNDARAWMSMGSLMLRAGRLQESLDCHRRALEADPTLKEALAGMAFTLGRMGRAEEGLAYARKAVELNPAWPFGYNVLGMELAQSGRMDESDAAFRKAIDLDPHDPQFYVNLASLSLMRGDRQGAVEALRRALDVDPENQDARSRLQALTGEIR
jgi:Flp pilus assembly protein TadD